MVKSFLLMFFLLNQASIVIASEFLREEQSELNDPNDPVVLLKEFGLYREGQGKQNSGLEKFPNSERRVVLTALKPILSLIERGSRMRPIFLNFHQTETYMRSDFIRLLKPLIEPGLNFGAIRMRVERVIKELLILKETRIKAEELKNSFVRVFLERKKGWPHNDQEDFKKLLHELLAKDQLGPSDTIALADLLTIEYLTLDTALSEGFSLRNSMGQLLISDRDIFKEQVEENFKIEALKNINKHYDKRLWSSHVEHKRDHTERYPTARETSTETLHNV